MYYINEIKKLDSEIPSELNFPNKYINLKKEQTYMEENNGLLWVWGTYYITGNFLLPNFSFSLDVDSSFGYFEKVNLKPINKVYESKLSNGELNYIVYKYYFFFSINLKDSYIFKNETRKRDIIFQFIPSFNQNVISDFNISVDEGLLKQFVLNINNLWTIKKYSYANTFDVNNDAWTTLNLNLLNYEQKNSIWLKAHNQLDHIMINDFISLYTKKQRKLLSGEIEIKYNLSDKEPKIIREIIDEESNIDELYSLRLKNWYEYNPYKKEFIKRTNYSSGIYSAYDLKVQIKCKLIINYLGMKRTFYSNYDYEFKSKDVNNLKSLMLIENKYLFDEKKYEAQSDQIN